MPTFIPISQLNDFTFCPYSIYLHNVYMDTDEILYHAAPQVKGKKAHTAIDNKTSSSKKTNLISLPIFSEDLGLVGRVDCFKKEEQFLIERKYNLKKIYKGHFYQLWAQYFCLIEMGYKISQLAFYEISSNTMMYQNLPQENEKQELKMFIQKMRNFDPLNEFPINENKCVHCIYSPLCDKTKLENVYS